MSSRVEELLAAAVDGSGTDGLDPPQSRNEKLLFALNDKLDNVQSELTGKVDVPADGQAYQQFVTDADGNVKWEDRLAYEVPEQWKLFTLDDASELAACCTEEAYYIGKTFRVVIDGQVFNDVPVVEYYSAGRVYGIGEPINDSNPVWSDDGYGFLIRETLTVAYNPDKFSSKPKVFTDTFVYELVYPSDIKQIDPKYIPSQRFDVTISEGDDGKFVSDKTPAEILEAYNNGQIVNGTIDKSGVNLLFAASNNDMAAFTVTDIDSGNTTFFIVQNDRTVVELLYPLLVPADNLPNGLILTTMGGMWGSSDSLILPSTNFVLPSSTSGSTKKFKITVDDTGTISATEVT